MESNYRILLVEDDPALGYLLTEYLKVKGFAISWAKNGKEGLQHLKSAVFDLAIVDVMMPEMDGFTFASHLADEAPKMPFLFLTAKSLKIDVLKGFSLGAVDYLKKPIDEEELVVRLQTLLARNLREEQPVKEQKIFKLGRYSYNPENLQLMYQGSMRQLTGRENELLLYLVKREGQLCTHKELLMAMWGKSDYFNRKSLNVFVSHLRKYLGDDPDISIENIHNQGFLLRISPK